MQSLFEWFLEQKGWIAFGVAATIYLITLVLWFGFGIFWPWGFVVGTVLAFAGLFFKK
jgi:hypothetical protein